MIRVRPRCLSDFTVSNLSRYIPQKIIDQHTAQRDLNRSHLTALKRGVRSSMPKVIKWKITEDEHFVLLSAILAWDTTNWALREKLESIRESLQEQLEDNFEEFEN